MDNIHIIATNGKESLMELKCPKCKLSVIVSVTSGLEHELELQDHTSTSAISKNDILDIKNFLTKFDGNFKKLFNTKK
ncbi:hypothetical protein GF354_03990 [Candidatus Peregrinibacteria bacterium]|nr:hypothetical protein [Candidatus Peregrinibacteria bacterium]